MTTSSGTRARSGPTLLRLLGVLILLALARAASAQEPPFSAHPAESGAAGASVLDRIAAEALARNLSLAQEGARLDAADAGVREARGRWLPSVSVESRYSEQSGVLDLGEFVNPVYGAVNGLLGEDRFPTDLSFQFPFAHQSYARVVQPVFDQRIRAGLSAARHTREAHAAQRAVRARAVVADAQQAFLQAAAARRAVEIWRATVPVTEEDLRVAERLLDAGTATPDAVFRARAEAHEVRQELLEATRRADAARRAFNRIVDRPLETPLDEIAPAQVAAPLAVDTADALASALARREELFGVRAGIRASEAGARAAGAPRIPSVALAFDYGVQGPEVRFDTDEDYWMASVVVSWTPFEGGRISARRDAAQAETVRLRLQEDELVRLVELEVRQAHDAARVAQEAIEVADARLEAARRSWTLVRRRWEEGLAPQIELLDARAALTAAELNRSVTLFTYAIHRIELERAAALRDLDLQEILR